MVIYYFYSQLQVRTTCFTKVFYIFVQRDGGSGHCTVTEKNTPINAPGSIRICY